MTENGINASVDKTLDGAASLNLKLLFLPYYNFSNDKNICNIDQTQRLVLVDSCHFTKQVKSEFHLFLLFHLIGRAIYVYG